MMPFLNSGNAYGGPDFEGKMMSLVLTVLYLEIPLGHLGRHDQYGIKYKGPDLRKK
jgi:hypothetical protein